MIRLTKDKEKTPPVDQDDPGNGKMQEEEMDGNAGHDGVNEEYVNFENTNTTLHDCNREDTAIQECNLETACCDDAQLDVDSS